MQKQYYDELQNTFAERFRESIPEMPVQSLKARVRQEFDRVRAEGKLDCLTSDEVRLLQDYREWKASPNCVTGVFHWRRKDLEIG